MQGTESPRTISTKQQRIAELAKRYRDSPFTTLAHHIDVEWLNEAYRRTRKDGASGVDGQTAQEYAANLHENLESLLNRAKSGDHYRAPPVRRVHIPKGSGKQPDRATLQRVVQGQPALTIGGTAEEVDREASGALRVLWYYPQYARLGMSLSAGRAHLEEVAVSAVTCRSTQLGLDERGGAQIPPPTGPAHCPLPRHVANLCTEEPDAGNPHVRVCGSPRAVTPSGHLDKSAKDLKGGSIAPLSSQT